MKLNVLSDLHLSRGWIAPPGTDADIVVLAGDIARPPEAIEWAIQLGKPVLYVPATMSSMAAASRGPCGS
jgi:predicted phosphodiesterase